MYCLEGNIYNYIIYINNYLTSVNRSYAESYSIRHGAIFQDPHRDVPLSHPQPEHMVPLPFGIEAKGEVNEHGGDAKGYVPCEDIKNKVKDILPPKQ